MALWHMDIVWQDSDPCAMLEPMTYLIAAVLALAAGPILDAGTARRRRFVPVLDGLVMAALPGLSSFPRRSVKGGGGFSSRSRPGSWSR